MILELDWNPIIDREGRLEKIVVAVRDVTALRSLEALNRKNREELEWIEQIMAVPRPRFLKFVDSVRSVMPELERIAAQSLAERQTQRLQSILHTLKGNARTMGFLALASRVHEVEDEVGQSADTWSDRIRSLRAAVDTMIRIGGTKLEPSDGQRLRAILEEITQLPLPAETAHRIRQLLQEFSGPDRERLTDLLDDIIQSSQRLALASGKDKLRVTIEDALDCALENEERHALFAVFTHLLSNAVDHGIETPDERKARGKPAQGHVAIRAFLPDPHTIRIEVRDDGRGLNIQALRNKARESDLLDPNENDPQKIAMTIFSHGFSTAKAVTLVSGRGVGLNAVVEILKSLGGSIRVEFPSPVTIDSTHASFAFIIDLPRVRPGLAV